MVTFVAYEVAIMSMAMGQTMRMTGVDCRVICRCRYLCCAAIFEIRSNVVSPKKKATQDQQIGITRIL